MANTNMDIINFTQLTNEITEGYFNEGGEYQPQLGMTNAMLLFYKTCINNDINPNEITVEQASEIFNEAFMKKFNEEIKSDNQDFSFGCAYRHAMDIVNVRKSSLEYTFSRLLTYIGGIDIDRLTELINKSGEKDDVHE